MDQIKNSEKLEISENGGLNQVENGNYLSYSQTFISHVENKK